MVDYHDRRWVHGKQIHCCARHLPVLQESSKALYTDTPDLLEICRHQSTTQYQQTTAVQSSADQYPILGVFNLNLWSGTTRFKFE